MLYLVFRGSCRNKHHLPELSLEFVEVQRAVVVSRGQTEAVVDKVLLSRTVAAAHSPYLRDCYVALVDEHDVILREVVEQCVRSSSRLTSCEYARVVLHYRAVADFLQHLKVVSRSFLNSLCFEQLVLRLEPLHTLFKLVFYLLKRFLTLAGIDNIVRCRIYRDVV